MHPIPSLSPTDATLRRLRRLAIHGPPALVAAIAFVAAVPATPAEAFAPRIEMVVVLPAEMSDDSAVDTTPDISAESPDATANDFLELERSLTECISSNPPPGCGRAPTGPGDRGGWQQALLFGVMMSGIAVIFWRVARAVRRREASIPD